MFGKIGLFPQSYTTDDPNVIQPAGPPQSATTGSQSSLNGPLQTLKEEDNDGNGVMKATLTDVQEAIEQLGRRDNDGGGSFSFASTRDGDVTDREAETDRDTDAENDGIGDNAWHKGARHNLAEKARAAAQAADAASTTAVSDDGIPAAVPTPTTSTMRSSQPPIEVEMSDESEGEEDGDGEAVGTHTHFPRRHHEDISEEEDEESARRASAPANPQPHTDVVEVPNETDKPIGTARQSTFSHSETLQRPGSPPSSHRFPSTPPITPSVASIPPAQVEFPSAIPRPTSEPELKAAMILPSPPSSSNGTSKQPSTEGPNFTTAHPSEWTVDDVVEWAKSKQFDKSVCDKFIGRQLAVISDYLSH